MRYDGAEVCELVGIYMLKQLGEMYDENYIGLYKDDGFAVFESING